jgi:predicted ATP-grasp superfamily ATP-dependent carboligase
MNITGLSEKKTALSFYSKYCNKKFISPNPRTNSDLFLKYILKIVKNDSYDSIFPIHTYTMFLLTKYRDMISDYVKVPPPNFDIFINAYDKKKTLSLAMENKIEIPITYFTDDINDIIENIKQYPVVIKASRRHAIGIVICYNSSDLKKEYKKMVNKYGPCLVQEYIPNGGEFGVYTIFNKNSEPIGLSVKKRLKCMNTYGGVSTLRETVDNKELVNIAFKLLKKMKWFGVAMVEFRFDSRDGLPKLMEINPRFWGSLHLSIQSGIDFPHMLYELISKGETTPMLDFKKGVQSRWLFGEVTRFIRFSNKLEVVKDFFTPVSNYDILSLKDPGPIVISTFFPPKDSSDEEPRIENPDLFLKESNVDNNIIFQID